MDRGWHDISTAPLHEIIETKIDDEHGARNAGLLMRQGRLWFVPDGSMYVYYTPTHWRLPTAEQMDNLAREANIKSNDWKVLAERYRHRAALTAGKQAP